MTDNLSPRELQAIRLIAYGNSSKEAAQALGISIHTFKDHTENARLKLQARTNTQAAVIVAQRGLL